MYSTVYEKPASHTHTSAADDIPVTRRTSVLIADSIIDIRRLPVSSRGLPLEANTTQGQGPPRPKSKSKSKESLIAPMSTLKSPAVSESLAPGRCVPTPAAAGDERPASIFPFLCPDLISNSDQYCTSIKLPLARGILLAFIFTSGLLPFEMMAREEFRLMHGSTESDSILVLQKFSLTRFSLTCMKVFWV